MESVKLRTHAIKTIYALLATLWLTTGCSWNSSQIQLMNWNWFGTPDSVIVQKGDTLYSISKKYNLPLRDLIEINHLRPPYILSLGQTVILPTSKFHEVGKGDTLYNISKRYGVDMTSLSRVNHLQFPYTLKIGQKLSLPGSIESYSSYTPIPTNSVKLSSTPVKASAPFRASSIKSHVSSPARKNSHISRSRNLAKSSHYSAHRRTSPQHRIVSKYRKSKFSWPLRGQVISHYGSIGKGRHNDGINIKAKLGATVRAADSGRVAYAGNELKGFGNLILIQHNDGWITAYAHNDRLTVRKGQRVKRGERIATAGSTGGVSSPQLHFEIRSGTKALNPISYLSK